MTDEQSNQYELILKQNYSNDGQARYSRALAETGMFGPHPDDTPEQIKTGRVRRQYVLDGGNLVIDHQGPLIGLAEEDCMIILLQLCDRFLSTDADKLKKISEMATQFNLDFGSKNLLLDDRSGAPTKSDPEDINEQDSYFAAGIQLEMPITAKTTLYTINSFLGASWGGESRRTRRESISRLSETMIKITEDGKTTSWKPLIETTELSDESTFQVQIYPQIMRLMKNYILIDMNIRQKLSSNLGKNLHRVLTLKGFPQRTTELRVSFNDLKELLGSRVNFSKTRQRLKSSREDKSLKPLDILKEAQFIGDSRFTGHGKKNDPYMLVIMPPNRT